METTTRLQEGLGMQQLAMTSGMIRQRAHKSRLRRRLFLNGLFRFIFSLSIVFALLVLGVLLYRVISQSIGWLDWQFLSSKLSINPDKAGIKGVLAGSAL
jgi:phosphate transport system permease protein